MTWFWKIFKFTEQAESYCREASNWSKQSMCFCHQGDWMSSFPASLRVLGFLNVPVFLSQPSSVQKDEKHFCLIKVGLEILCEQQMCADKT